ncbi:inward rectifier potassium channel protein [Gemmatimonadetes bacterium T265]|nr:inward rectifier potassium channel protein [Gemmatimonadetes bacterium T265]
MADQPPTSPPPQRANLDNDLGFGAVVSRESRRRLLNPDGSFNVRREGLGPIERFAPYHTALLMPWPQFLAYFTAAYLGTNVLFAVAFWLCGPAALVDSGHTLDGNTFVRAFFFSVETFATIGYGAVAPVGVAANVVVTVEALVSILAVALVTGLVFARFSRPTARVRFSRIAVLAPYNDGGTAFMFRLVNERRTELLQLEIRVLFAYFVEQGGRRTRRYDQLALERERVTFIPLALTVVHPITADSPLAGLDREALNTLEAEFLILLSAVDETNAQVVHARTSYKPDEIVAGVKFANLFNPPRPDGTLSIDVSRLDDVEPATAPVPPNAPAPA